MMRCMPYTLIALLASATAQAQAPQKSIVCEFHPPLTHCWGYPGGQLLWTTQDDGNGYSHIWTPKGEMWTEWRHDGKVESWPMPPMPSR